MKKTINIGNAIVNFNIIVAILSLIIATINIFKIHSNSIMLIINTINIFIIIQCIIMMIIADINLRRLKKELDNAIMELLEEIEKTQNKIAKKKGKKDE